MYGNPDVEDQEADVLRLSVEDWCQLLQNPSIFHEDLLKCIVYIHHQPRHESTATETGYALGVGAPMIRSWYVNASQKIYSAYQIEPQIGSQGNRRFWNTLFIKLQDEKQQTVKRDGHSLYRLILRPNLVTAMECMGLV